MMDTVLNLGLNDATVEGLIKLTGNERFVYDSYRRFLMMLSDVAYSDGTNHLAKHDFEHIFYAMKKDLGVTDDLQVNGEQLKQLCETYKAHIKTERRARVPAGPHPAASGLGRRRLEVLEQRPRYPLPPAREDLAMTWARPSTSRAWSSATRARTAARASPSPATPRDGTKEVFGEYLMNAQGEDVVAGVRTPMPISQLKVQNPEMYRQFDEICTRLELHYKDMQDIEFTIEHNKLFILQCRSGKRTGPSAVKIAVDLVNEGLISKETALARINPELLDQCLHPIIKPGAKYTLLATGLPAGPGAATGIAVFDATRAAEMGKGGLGQRVILVRADTSPDDLKGMLAAEGVLTERGGMTSHAALVARGFGIPTVAGCSDISVGPNSFTVNGKTINEGDPISLNGTPGRSH